MGKQEIHPHSVLFLVVDSCRFDTFEQTDAPNMKSVAPVHKAQSPSYFTFGSHSAMFMGFTPGMAELKLPYLNPKLGKVFKLVGGGGNHSNTEAFHLSGRNIIDGFNRKGYVTIGSGAVAWFDLSTETGRVLSRDFEHFFYPESLHALPKQLEFIDSKLSSAAGKPAFVFLNVGETHVPYYFEGANWDHNDNPGQAFQEVDRSDECRYRQRLACEYVDKQVAGLIERFKHATILVCADHGDCWGEDGLWEHGIAHPMTLTVPLMLRVAGMPVSRENAEEVAARVKDVLKTANPSQPEVSHQLGKLRRRIKRTAREAKSK